MHPAATCVTSSTPCSTWSHADIPWHYLPHDCPHWNIVYQHFGRRQQAGSSSTSTTCCGAAPKGTRAADPNRPPW
ncbi:hypothetical protein C6Y14_11980 [Streptomyces dioscori]|uniref:Transposase n=1 Tax=Streptomyces dioscori TaxID=2109333 RepID=A0A2P8Q9H0_9ACTN|nr:hypothetical protein C6Y14_11980 [Streptomyces dioscori]